MEASAVLGGGAVWGLVMVEVLVKGGEEGMSPPPRAGPPPPVTM